MWSATTQDTNIRPEQLFFAIPLRRYPVLESEPLVGANWQHSGQHCAVATAAAATAESRKSVLSRRN